ncbi:hypothetical protein GOP47_0025971 [Adiantum capillus-veneris]|uniref:Pentatricopeptide repeat-containing protein n=1 Tax=Adiantum capillus-veneris TaxID=13818 RepID=A0A9D4U1X1_ADICA|nr:hypothetical protein GOP47_0025971 [Adiantum capillus-veneris]
MTEAIDTFVCCKDPSGACLQACCWQIRWYCDLVVPIQGPVSSAAMSEFGLNISKAGCYLFLQRCTCLERGETIFHVITNEGFETDSFLGTHCIRMYGQFGRVKEANRVFSSLPRCSNVYAWSAIIFANAMLGQSAKALHLYSHMNLIGVRPDSHTFVAVLKACTNDQELTYGMHVHAHVIEWGFETVDYVGSGLIDLYVCCHRLHDARLVLDRQLKPNVVLWSALIHGYYQNGHFVDAISLFEKMLSTGAELSQVTHVSVIKAWASFGAVRQGMWMHSLVTEAGDELQTFVGSSLVDMYGRYGMLHDARKIFEKLQKQDVVEWNAMIAAETTQHASVQEVFQLHDQMQQQGIESNQSTLTCIVKACAYTRSLKLGKQVHAHVVGRGLMVDLFLTNVLVNLYAKCGDIQSACKIFKTSKERTSATWSAMIAGCAEHGHVQTAFQLFGQMNEEGKLPNSVVFLSILNACVHIVDLKSMHSFIVEAGFELDGAVASNLISRYGQCTCLTESLRVFEHLLEHDVVNWNSLINAYAQHGHTEKAFSLFYRMQVEKIRPDYVTYNTMISLCAREGLASEALQLFQRMQSYDIQPDAKVFSRILEVCSKLETPQAGKLIYGQMVESGLEVDVNVGEALVCMYLLSGGVEDAEKTFDRINLRDTGIWNTMISGYVRSGHLAAGQSCVNEKEGAIPDGHLKKVFQLYRAMTREEISPNPTTFVCMLKLCSKMVAFGHCKQIYAHIVEAGFDQDLLIGNMLVHVYTWFYCFEDALHVFTKLGTRNVATFNTLFTAFAQQSNIKSVLDGFHFMQRERLKADEITVLSLLSACSHAGKQDEALFHFQTMRDWHGIEPIFTHYICMADLLGRMGYVKEGQGLLQTMPFQPNTVGYTSILRHCTMHSSLYTAKEGWFALFKEDCDSEGYV